MSCGKERQELKTEPPSCSVQEMTSASAHFCAAEKVLELREVTSSTFFVVNETDNFENDCLVRQALRRFSFVVDQNIRAKGDQQTNNDDYSRFR